MATQTPIKDIISHYTLFVDGNIFTGDVDGVTMPDLKKHMDDYRGGGMDMPVEVQLGHEKVMFSFELTAHSALVYNTYGLTQGNHKLFKFYGELLDIKGNKKGVQIEVEGPITELNAGDAKPGQKTNAKITVNAYYLKHTIDNVEVLEIDALNMVFKSNGVDQLAATRQLLGM